MKRHSPDVILLKAAIKRHTELARLSKQLARLPHNRPEKYREATWPENQRFDWDSGRALCCLRSQQNGRLNSPQLTPTLADQTAWLNDHRGDLPDEITMKIDFQGVVGGLESSSVFDRILVGVKWRLERESQKLEPTAVTAPTLPVPQPVAATAVKQPILRRIAQRLQTLTR